MLKKMLFLFLGLGTFLFAQAQLPTSNVYLFDLEVTDTSIEVTKPRFLTHFNERGYNNQPNFFSNEELYLTVRAPFDNQTDLFKFDLEEKTKTLVTSTPAGEFSAQRTE